MADEEDDGCSRCGECCKVLIFQDVRTNRIMQEKYETHGCTFLPGIGILVPSVCQHLKETPIFYEHRVYECNIYETRPRLCRNKYIRQRGMGSWKPEGCTRRGK